MLWLNFWTKLCSSPTGRNCKKNWLSFWTSTLYLFWSNHAYTHHHTCTTNTHTGIVVTWCGAGKLIRTNDLNLRSWWLTLTSSWRAWLAIWTSTNSLSSPALHPNTHPLPQTPKKNDHPLFLFFCIPWIILPEMCKFICPSFTKLNPFFSKLCPVIFNHYHCRGLDYRKNML